MAVEEVNNIVQSLWDILIAITKCGSGTTTASLFSSCYMRVNMYLLRYHS